MYGFWWRVLKYCLQGAVLGIFILVAIAGKPSYVFAGSISATADSAATVTSSNVTSRHIALAGEDQMVTFDFAIDLSDTTDGTTGWSLAAADSNPSTVFLGPSANTNTGMLNADLYNADHSHVVELPVYLTGLDTVASTCTDLSGCSPTLGNVESASDVLVSPTDPRALSITPYTFITSSNPGSSATSGTYHLVVNGYFVLPTAAPPAPTDGYQSTITVTLTDSYA